MSRRERVFMAAAAVVWLMLTAFLPLVNNPGARVAGIPLLWFWVLVWVWVVPVLLSVAYYFLEVRRP